MRLKPFCLEGINRSGCHEAEESRGILEQTLTQWGGIVHATPVYRNVLPVVDMDPLVELLQKGELDWITFSSSSTVRNFFELLPDAGRIALTKADSPGGLHWRDHGGNRASVSTRRHPHSRTTKHRGPG